MKFTYDEAGELVGKARTLHQNLMAPGWDDFGKRERIVFRAQDRVRRRLLLWVSLGYHAPWCESANGDCTGYCLSYQRFLAAQNDERNSKKYGYPMRPANVLVLADAQLPYDQQIAILGQI